MIKGIEKLVNYRMKAYARQLRKLRSPLISWIWKDSSAIFLNQFQRSKSSYIFFFFFFPSLKQRRVTHTHKPLYMLKLIIFKDFWGKKMKIEKLYIFFQLRESSYDYIILYSCEDIPLSQHYNQIFKDSNCSNFKKIKWRFSLQKRNNFFPNWRLVLSFFFFFFPFSKEKEICSEN